MTVGHWETCPTCNGSGVVQPPPLPTFDNSVPVATAPIMRVCTEADVARLTIPTEQSARTLACGICGRSYPHTHPTER